MLTFYIDPVTHDIEFDGQGTLRTITETAEKEQSLRLAAETGLCEWFLDIYFGLDWKAILGRKPADLPIIKAAVQDFLQRYYRVDSLESLTVTFAGRELTISFIVVVDRELISLELEV